MTTTSTTTSTTSTTTTTSTTSTSTTSSSTTSSTTTGVPQLIPYLNINNESPILNKVVEYKSILKISEW